MHDHPVTHDTNELLSPEDVCRVLKLGRTVVYRLLNSGSIPSIRIGNQHRVRRGDLDAYLSAQAPRQHAAVSAPLPVEADHGRQF